MYVSVCAFVNNREFLFGYFSYIYLGSILASVDRFTLGADLAWFHFNSIPSYVMCVHKTSYRAVVEGIISMFKI